MKSYYKNIFCSFFIVTTLFSVKSQAQQEQPNIIVLMADDIGLGDISFYQKTRADKKITVPTPNIDKLIDSGMRFTDAHSPASLCAPTRFSMLTGNYSYRNQKPFGVWTPEANALIDENNFTTSARIAKKGCYNTAFLGKWGLGGSWVKTKGKKIDDAYLNGGALSYGFDYACELPEGIQNEPYAFYENREWMKLEANSVLKELDANQTGYATSKKYLTRGGLGDSNWDPKQAGLILAHKAVDYIEKQKGAGQPFFMYYCSQAVHIPHEPPATFDGVQVKGKTAGKHGDMIYELDMQVGLIIEALKRTGAYKNTLFIFTSDNGGLSFDKDMKAAGHDTSNGLSGSKGSINEGGHRVPFVAVWPKIIKPNSVSKELISGQDIVATVAALANQLLDKAKVFDSANLLPVFKSENKVAVHQYLMHQSAGGPTYALRDGNWKLIMRSNNKKKSADAGELTPTHLYDLSKNLSEDTSKNLVKEKSYAKRVLDMLAKYIELRKTGHPTVTN